MKLLNELRIGNFINGIYLDDGDSELTDVCRVLTIDSVGAAEYPIWVEGTQSTEELYNEFQPIPLTKKWLEDFGFKKFKPTGSLALLYIKSIHEFDLKKLVIYLERDYFTVAFADYYTGKEKTELFPLKYKYVHQLQNLYFALTGQELTLNPQPHEHD